MQEESVVGSEQLNIFESIVGCRAKCLCVGEKDVAQ